MTIQVKATGRPCRYQAELSCGAVYCAEHGGSKFRVCGRNLSMKATEQCFPVLMFYYAVYPAYPIEQNRTKNSIEPNRTPIVRLGSVVEQNRTSILL